MHLKLLRKRLRRSFRRSQRQVEDLSSTTEHGLEQYVFRRLGKFMLIRRFVISWLLLIVLIIGGLIGQNLMLSNYYQKVKAVPGGIYKEGILGTYSNANPLFATSSVDTTVSKLIFASLFTHDRNGQIVGDLASGYTTDARGITYTVKLKPDLLWQDGRPLTSQDVLFTFQTIQNPDVKSPLQSSWQGIKVTAPDPQTVVFTLPNPLASFIYNLTTGIVPKHALSDIQPADFRSADFNTLHPIGAGPFMMKGIQVESSDPMTAEQQLALLPYEQYHAGKPKLQEFVVHTYADKQQLIKAFQDKQLTAVEGLMEMPDELKDDATVRQVNLLLRAATMSFFKTSHPILSNQKVRTALVQAADVPSITAKLEYPTKVVRQPFLRGQIGYDPSLLQPGHNKKAAEDTLTADGWVLGKDGMRKKGNQPLGFSITAADTEEYRMVTNMLQKQWEAVGARVKVDIQDPTEFQTSLTSHNYDILLYGIAIGTDPDVFVYWHSSQADIRAAQRLNFSEYSSKAADTALEAGRTRLDPTLRAVKYKPFLEAWQKDSPALALYQPRALYLTNGPVDGLSEGSVNGSIDRLNNVHNWQIRFARVTNE